MGKSLLKKLIKDGGQNPIEPAKFGCKIFHGPFVYNFEEIYRLLKSYNITEQVENYNDLTNESLKNYFNSVYVRKANPNFDRANFNF